MATADLTRRHGELIGGRYRLLDVIGEGGQSVLYRAEDLKDRDMVAIKILKGSPDPAVRERMFREAFAMTALSGTSAVRIYHQHWTHDGAMCLVMELLHGLDLESWLERAADHGVRPAGSDLFRILTPVAETLEAAHAQGIVHRDMKPANIFLIDQAHGGGVRVLDFGFAKLVRAPAITSADMIAGSPRYIAPESWHAGKKALLDHRADVYALGAIVFRALAGRVPFPEDNLVQLLTAVTTAPRPSLVALRPDLPPDVDHWVEQALAIEPAARFLSVRGMWNALKRALHL
jgi:serine/threonine protein kinase